MTATKMEWDGKLPKLCRGKCVPGRNTCVRCYAYALEALVIELMNSEPEPCYYKKDYCRTHGFDQPCLIERSIKLLAEGG